MHSFIHHLPIPVSCWLRTPSPTCRHCLPLPALPSPPRTCHAQFVLVGRGFAACQALLAVLLFHVGRLPFPCAVLDRLVGFLCVPLWTALFLCVYSATAGSATFPTLPLFYYLCLRTGPTAVTVIRVPTQPPPLVHLCTPLPHSCGTGVCMVRTAVCRLRAVCRFVRMRRICDATLHAACC